MDKNIKKLISEAFNELYEEMVNEAPTTMEKKGMTDDEIEPAIQRALKRGSDKKLEYDFEPNSEQETNFNIAIDNLINTYKNPNSQSGLIAQGFSPEQIKANAKSAIQAAFSPHSRKLKNLFRQYKNRPDFEEMVSDAYELIMLRNFDKTLKAYKKPNGTFGGLVATSMKNRMLNYISGGYGAEKTARGDVYSGGSDRGTNMISVDQTIGDDGKMTVGDKISDTPSSDSEFRGKGKLDIPTAKEILENILTWVENHVGSPEYKSLTPEIAIIFREVIKGSTYKQIFNDFPEIQPRLKKHNNIPIYFRRFTESEAGRDISDMVSNIYGINFNLSDIDPNTLTQSYSQSPEWSGGGKISEKASEEMKKIQADIKNLFIDAGMPTKVTHAITAQEKDETGEWDYKNSALKKGIKFLEDNNKEEELSRLYDLLNKHVMAKKADKAKGGYGSAQTPLPSSEEEEMRSMFEGIADKDIDTLMERVIKRLSK